MWKRGMKMFTGIVEEIGRVQRIERNGRSAALTIDCELVLDGTKIGDSIAVNGTCLTVTRLSGRSFAADVTPETLSRTAFSILQAGSPVNLERALRLGDRVGGHLVSGHIDGTGKVLSAVHDGNAVNLQIAVDPNKMKYILEKGSIAVDGVSLTVAGRERDRFSVSVIPHTGTQTTLLNRRPGDPVNLEFDMLGKYVEQFLKFEARSELTMDTLRAFQSGGGHYGI